jgi:hypothetical protein
VNFAEESVGGEEHHHLRCLSSHYFPQAVQPFAMVFEALDALIKKDMLTWNMNRSSLSIIENRTDLIRDAILVLCAISTVEGADILNGVSWHPFVMPCDKAVDFRLCAVVGLVSHLLGSRMEMPPSFRCNSDVIGWQNGVTHKSKSFLLKKRGVCRDPYRVIIRIVANAVGEIQIGLFSTAPGVATATRK